MPKWRTGRPAILLVLVLAVAGCTSTGETSTGKPNSPAADIVATAGIDGISPRTEPASTRRAVPGRKVPEPSGNWRRTPVPAFARSDRVRVWGLSAWSWNGAWAVGSVSPKSSVDIDVPSPHSAQRPLALRWDGRRWREFPVPASVSLLTSVAAAGSGEAWAVGWSESPSGQVGHLLHWSGGVWREAPPTATATAGASGISPAAAVHVVAGDGRNRVYLGGSDHDVELVARWTRSGWRRLPSPPDNGAPPGAVSGGTNPEGVGHGLTVQLLSVAVEGRLFSGAVPFGFDATMITSWDGHTWRSERVVAGSHVSVGTLLALDGDHVWYTATQSFMGGPVGARTASKNWIEAYFLGPAALQDAPSDPYPPAVETMSGHGSILQWAAGGGVVARYRGRKWVDDRSKMLAGVKVQELAAVPGARGTWLAGAGATGLVLLRHR